MGGLDLPAAGAATGASNGAFDVELGPAGRVVRLDGKLVRSTAAALGRRQRRAVRARGPAAPPCGAGRPPPLSRSGRSSMSSAATTRRRARSRRSSATGTRCSSGRGAGPRPLLDAYDDELARTGARVVMRRRRAGRCAGAAPGRPFSSVARRSAGRARLPERGRGGGGHR